MALWLGAQPVEAQRGPPRRSGSPGWEFRASAAADLWFHAMAVIAADEPGPLGLYSADYARRVREAKRERGLYPTVLDSLAERLRNGIREEFGLNSSLHFVPLYFPAVEPAQLLDALDAVARKKTDDARFREPEFRYGVLVLTNVVSDGGQRNVLRRMVRAVEEEWRVFYRDWGDSVRAAERPRYEAMRELWNDVLGPKLDHYLSRQRLRGGIVMPSPALGPEGRIIPGDDFDGTDQVVAMQMPLSTERADVSVFAFIKELCFLLQDARLFGPTMENASELEAQDLQRRVAVRCGALLLQFYAPTLTSAYRRAFLDAVGAEDSRTVEAFERVYAVDPEIYERLRQRIRRP